jgi:O-antigen ligase
MHARLKKLSFHEIFFYTLVFLFPLAGNSVQSWTSTIFWALVVLSLITRPWRHVSLADSERLVLTLVALIFCSMMISNLVNGWGYTQTKGLGVQFRYLGFLAIYFAFRKYQDSLCWLMRGTVLAAIILLCQGIYDVYVLELDRAYGHYLSPGLFAIQALIFALFMASALSKADFAKLPRPLIAIGLFCAIFSLFLSGSRTTFLTLFLLVISLPLAFLTRKKAFYLILVSGLILTSIYFSIGIVHQQVNKGLSEISDYLKDPEKLDNASQGSVGQRLEMWRASGLIILENPAFGIGWRNFSRETDRLIEDGRANASIAMAPHPHNTYLEFWVSNGLIGFSLLIAFFFFSYRLANTPTIPFSRGSILLKIFILIFAVNSINEGGTLIYGNTTSFFFVYFGVLLAEVLRQEKISGEPVRQGGAISSPLTQRH